MAKAKEITGIDCAADALVWAGEVLRVRFEEVLEARDAALDFSDIEGVHQMRVATRRLRSALRDFLPLMQKRSLGKARKKFKRIADALGAVRDEDVATLALERLQSAAEIDDAAGEQVKSGIEAMFEERRKTRDEARANLIEMLDADDLAKLQANFAAALDKALTGKKKSARVVSFNEAGRAAVASSLEELCDLGDCVYEPFNVEQLHEMRIAAKRLRYAVELFTACWGEKIALFASEIAKLQTFLGEVHDADVWLRDLSRRLRERRNDSENGEFQAAAWLMSEFVKTRTKNYRYALKLWSDWQTNDFTGRMRTIIETE